MESDTLARRKNVITLITRGFSPTEIAEALNTSRETVYNDLRAIRESVEPELIGHTKKEILHGVIMTRFGAAPIVHKQRHRCSASNHSALRR